MKRSESYNSPRNIFFTVNFKKKKITFRFINSIFKILILICVVFSYNSIEAQYSKLYHILLKQKKEQGNGICSSCNGQGIKHSYGAFSTRAHPICNGQGCYDCNYKGTESYRGTPFDYECGSCFGSGKSKEIAELENISKLRKIYIRDHTFDMVDHKAQVYYRPKPSNLPSYTDLGEVNFLYFNDNTKRVFDKFGNPLFDIGYLTSSRHMDVIFCGDNAYIDNLKDDMYGMYGIKSRESFNRKIRYPIFVVGPDFTKNHGCGVDGYNVSVRYSYKIAESKSPLIINAVSKVETKYVDFNDHKNGIINQEIIDKYIVMMYMTLAHNDMYHKTSYIGEMTVRSTNKLLNNTVSASFFDFLSDGTSSSENNSSRENLSKNSNEPLTTYSTSRNNDVLKLKSTTSNQKQEKSENQNLKNLPDLSTKKTNSNSNVLYFKKDLIYPPRLRDNPSPLANIIYECPVSAEIKLIDKNVDKNGVYWKVEIHGKTGYLSSQCFESNFIYFKKDIVFEPLLRDKPSSSSNVIYECPKSAQVKVLEKNGLYWKVEVHGKTGYLSSTYF